MAGRNDLTIYDRNANEWDDADSRTFRSLHSVGASRLDRLRAWLSRDDWGIVADIGSGGGILASRIASHAGRVFAFDRSFASLDRLAQRSIPSLTCVRADATCLPISSGSVDVALLADIIEHVEDWPAVLSEAARIVKPGGHVYVSTINRSRRATVLAVHLAEGLGYVPKGTHDPALFVRPEELERVGRENALVLTRITGERPRVMQTLMRRRLVMQSSPSTAVSYCALFRKAERAA
ncbi:MAG: methyltransferase domain-containing protein [Planctomycetes bacterium]|nr:methyltransferase domain-containing protein [Planctomycetota bacterium]MCB9919209.1 methyltransferase domain-containing protein [Planctomycetota bacterium]